MTHQEDLYAAEMPEEQPSMELLDGAEPGNPTRRSMFGQILRGTLYGLILLSASALLAISAVPDLANYATFIPDTKTQSHCGSYRSACTALNVASLKDTPCCLESEKNVASAGGCTSSCQKAEMLASIAAGLKSCCSTAGSATDTTLADEAPTETLLTDEQLALLPEGEDLD